MCSTEVKPAGAAGFGRRALSVHRAGRVMSHKLATYFDASLPSCPGRSGAPSEWEGTGSVPVARGRPTGALWALSGQCIDFRGGFYPRFMAVYARLFLLKLLNLCELRELAWFFSSKRTWVFQRERHLSLFAGRLRRCAGRAGTAKSRRLIVTQNYDTFHQGVRHFGMATGHLIRTQPRDASTMVLCNPTTSLGLWMPRQPASSRAV